MKNTIKKLSILFFASLVMFSCNKQPTIQEYYIEKQDSGDFLALDIPASILKVGDQASEDTKETLATIKKLNVLAFKINDANKDQYDAEYARVKEILKSDNYNELMRMKHENINIVINYQGEDDAVDEFILLAADKSKGFALARVLGDKMQPQKIIKMTEDFKNIDKDGAGEALGQLSELFGD
jgi:hypothetical protein